MANPYDQPLQNVASIAALSRFGGLAALNFAQSLAMPLFGSISRESSYYGNTIGRTIVPSVGELVNLWWSGRCNETDINRMMNMQGITWNAALRPRPGERDFAWWNIVDLKQPQWSLDTYKRWWMMGRIGDAEFNEKLRRAGFNPDTDIEYGSNARNAELFKRDFSAPPLQDLVMMLWRNLITPSEFRQYLIMHGFWRFKENNAYEELTKNIPGPSDLVRFAVRHVFEPDIIRQFGFDAEISQDFLDWHEKQGFGWKFDIKHKDFGEWKDATWAQAFWWSHWVWPAPTQLYEFYQRARPLPDDPERSRLPGVKPFTYDQLKLGLRGNDYPPMFRDYLAAISFRPPTRYDAQYAWQMGQIDDQELTEMLRDVAYNEHDAALVSATIRRRINYRRFIQLLGRMGFQARNAFRDKILDRETAGAILDVSTAKGFEDIDNWVSRTWEDRKILAKNNKFVQASLDILERIPSKTESLRVSFKRKSANQLAKCTEDAYTLGILQRSDALSNLEALDINPADAELSLNAIDMCHTTTLVKETVRVIRSQYLRGQITQAQAQDRLAQAGILEARRAQYLTLWQIQFTPRRKELATGQVLSLVRGGELAAHDAVNRLSNLGWVNPDALVLTAQAEASFNRTLAREQRAQSPRLPMNEMKAFVRDGFLPPATLHEEMATRGYPAAVIDATIHALLTPRSRATRTGRGSAAGGNA